MRKKIAKGFSYAVAPKTTFTALHPRTAVYTKAATWLAGHVMPSRRRRSHKRSVVAGLGAAAVSVPLGLYLGRKMMHDRNEMAGTAAN